MDNSPINSSRSKGIIFLLAAYLIFVILTAVINYILPFSTYLFIFLGVLGVALLLYFLPKNKDIGVGKGRAKTAINLILLVLLLAILAIAGWGLSFFGSADRIYHAEGKSSLNLGSDFDFGKIEIEFTETPKIGNAIEVYIGPYKAWTGIGDCKYFSGRVCYKGWWYYNLIGVSTEDTEVFYDENITKPLRILKVGSIYGAVWIGDSHIIGLDQSTSLTPTPVEGEKKISCSGCKIKEVKVYYNFFARLKNRLGWT